MLDAITNALANQEKVQILDLVHLKYVKDLQTGEEMQIAPSKAPAFKAGKELKETVK